MECTADASRIESDAASWYGGAAKAYMCILAMDIGAESGGATALAPHPTGDSTGTPHALA